MKSAALAAIVAMILSLAGVAEAHPFNAKDMAALDRAGDPRVSPDGRWAVYDLRVADYDANTSAHELWIVDLTKPGAEPRRLKASDGGASAARWSADGRIFFISGRSGSGQVWATDPAGETAHQVTSLPFDVDAFAVTADGRRIVVSQPTFPDCPTLGCTQDRMEARAASKMTGVVYDRVFVRHWDTWADGRRNHLFVQDLDDKGVANGEARDLMAGVDGDTPTKPFGDDADFALSPDGKRLVYSVRIAGKTEPWSTNFDLYSVSLDGGAAQNLTEANKAWDAAPAFSPDGSKLAYLAMKRPGFEADRFGVMVRDLKTGQVREVDPDWDRSPGGVAWSADGTTLYATAQDVGQTRLFALNIASGAAKPLTGDGHVGGVSVAGGRVVYAQDRLDAPADLYLLAGAKPRQLTHHNAQALADIEFGAYEQFSFPGWNGETVHGYLVKPVGYEPGRKYPVAFLIHGGPQGSFGNLFHYRWNAQAYAGAGYAVVMIDFHGSTGYGQAFTDSISRHWGDRPLEDLQKGWDFALAKYPLLDGDRACALGGSYGGFMINWIAGNWPDPWKCLVNHDGIFDSRAMGYSTEELWFSEWENGGPPYAEGTTYEQFNPATHVAQWRTPMLVVHGGKDFRVPLEQGLSTFNALQRRGIESRLLYYPNENHWVLKPQNSVQWHDEVLGWLSRWTGAGE